MKNLLKFNFVLALVATFVMSSCSDDEKKSTDADIDKTVDAALQAEYTTEDVATSKENIEESAVDLVNNLKSLEQEEAIDVISEMAGLMESLGSETSTASINVPIKSALAISNGNTVEVYNVLKSATEGEKGLQAGYNDLKGTYTYSFEKQSFDVEENNNAIVFLFPGKSGDKTNTGELIISDFAVQEISSPRSELEEEKIEAPTSLKVTLKYKSNEIMTYTLSASYMSDGTPTSLSNVLTLGKFTFSQILKNTDNKEASFDYSFKSGDAIIVAFGAKAAGNWSEENIEANTKEKSETYTNTEDQYNESTGQYESVEVSHTETWQETDFEEIINSSNAYIQFVNLKAVGKVNIKAMVDGEQAFDKAHENNRDQYGDYPDEIKEKEADNLVALAKENVELVLTYVDKNTLIAKIEPYKAEETETYTDNDGNVHTYKDFYMDMKMVFKDDSNVSMSTFVETELSGFFSALNDFIKTINNNYDAGIDPVETSK